jgi:hypothetical protein
MNMELAMKKDVVEVPGFSAIQKIEHIPVSHFASR